MIPQRLSVKFFTRDQAGVNLAPFIPLFHRWIQNKTVPGLLIDVAGYEHVPEGPGVLLIGHEVDYGIDLTAAKPGLLVRRKRYDGHADLAAILRDTLHKAVTAAAALNGDSGSGIQLDPGTVEISLIDRLRSPNTAESLASVTGHIEPVLRELYPVGFETSRGSEDPRACLSLIATASTAVDFQSLLSRLST